MQHQSENDKPTKSRPWVPAMVFAILAFLLYADVLFDNSTVPAAPSTDITVQFISWRDFGFSEMARGHIPLWNPHIFCGTPYMASFQSALFYPPNWVHLIVPVGLGISWYCAIHTFLMGFFTSLWARYRGASPLAQTLAGVMMMFSGQFFLHLFAGHLPHLGVMVWIPLILLSLDALADGKTWRWGLLGTIALAMQILAGHPQYVFYTGLFVSMYVVLKLAFSRHRVRLLLGTASVYMTGVLLACIQLVPGIAAAGENIRVTKLPYAMASEFSMHPLHLLTLAAPYVFGDQQPAVVAGNLVHCFYFAPGYLWELCLFSSVTGLVLAVYALCKTSRATRIVCGVSLATTLVLASGSYTPLHRFLYDHLPFFGSFRVPAKFLFFFCLIISLLASEGLDMLRQQTQTKALRNVVLLAAGAILLATTAVLIPTVWNSVLARLASGPDHFLIAPDTYHVPVAASQFLHTFITGMAIAFVTLAIISCAMTWLRGQRLAWALVGLAVIELAMFAHVGRGSTQSQLSYPPEWMQALSNGGGRNRSFHVNSRFANVAMSLGTFEMWGYDPGLPRRYGLLVSASQGIPAEEASQYLHITNKEPFARLFRMFRLRWVFVLDPQPIVVSYPSPMPQAALIGQWKCIPKLEDQIQYAISKEFDPGRMVITETEPAIVPAGEDVQGEVKVTNIDTDTMIIEATTDKPAMLVVTDNYAKGWTASPLVDSSQREYEVMPVDVCLRGIPLAGGKHRIWLEYRPYPYVIGRWITAVSAIGYLLLVLLAYRQTKKVGT